ncbi:MAG: virulence RhuM family protein [Oscillospiraceae bacterium]|nr:virulence RhuM family protein [Oscillospiraceae bacterium]
MDELQKGEILIYQSESGDTKIDVYLEDGTVWLSQALIAELYQTTAQNIIMHTKNIYKDCELTEAATCKQSLQVQNEGSRTVRRSVKYYNLDMILAIGYRVRSHIGMQFRNWATGVLTEYMKKGFALNDARLKNPKQFGDDYFDELLARIRDIRASEKRFYMKVRDIYALSVDYDPKLEMTKEFFATVQNKLHYAVHGMTAAELIVSRADSEKTNMGLTTYSGEHVLQSDVTIAKNYLERDELEDLNRIVTMFLDHAEDMARQKIPMYMKDWIASLDEFLTFRKRNILQGRGKVSNADMERRALTEYAKYNTRILKMPELDNDDDSVIDDLNEATKSKE